MKILKKKKVVSRFEIAGVCFGFRTGLSRMRNKINALLQGYSTRKRVEVLIDVEPDSSLPVPSSRISNCHIRNGECFVKLYLKSKVYVFKINQDCSKIICYITFYKYDDGFFRYFLPKILGHLILPRKGVWALHACGVVWGRKALLFLADSGGGKTTLARFARRRGLTVLNDERVFIMKKNSFFLAYANPWSGKMHAVLKNGVQVSHLFFLFKSNSHRLSSIKPHDVLRLLIGNNFVGSFKGNAKEVNFDFCCGLAYNVPSLKLFFKKEITVWSFLNEFFNSNSQD